MEKGEVLVFVAAQDSSGGLVMKYKVILHKKVYK